MELLAVGLILFFVMHLVPSATSLHSALKARLGENPFKGLFALVSFAGIALIVIGMGKAEFVSWYEPPSWGKHITALLMIISLYCLISMQVSTSIRIITAHPMLWGMVAWSAGHLLSNGDQASVVLFGSFLIYSLFAMASANRRGARPQGEALQLKTDGIVLMASSAIYTGLMFFHARYTGVSLIN